MCVFCTVTATATVAPGDRIGHPGTVLMPMTVIAPSVQTPPNEDVMPQPVTMQVSLTPPPYQEHPPSFEQSQTEQSTQETTQERIQG